MPLPNWGRGRGQGPLSAASFPANDPPGVDVLNAQAAARDLAAAALAGEAGAAAAASIPLLPMAPVGTATLPRPQGAIPRTSTFQAEGGGCPFVNAKEATEAGLRAKGAEGEEGPKGE